MNNKFKKIIVNSLTFSRIIGTVLMPFLYTWFNSFTFLVIIGLLLLTDFFDGLLAKIWGVSTIFGSLLDMLADKLLALGILVILGIMYPLMFIPLIFEILITIINIRSAFLGSYTKSSEIGRIKMWILGVSIFSLLLTGLCLNLESILTKIDIFEFIITYSKEIEYVVISASIVAEFIVACDYFIRMIKYNKKNNIKLKFSDINNNIDYIKKVLFDEDYYYKTKNMSLSEKFKPIS